MNRRTFIRFSSSYIIIASQPFVVKTAFAASAEPKTYKYHITPFRGRLSEIERIVSQDDDWAKQELISQASEAIRVRESVIFKNFFRTVLNWRPADSLLTLRDEINQLAPRRSIADDGFVGDANHATRTSDHNPWIKDGRSCVVSAFDMTHDPKNGCNAEELASSLVSARDHRVKYIIWNRRIVNGEAIGSSSPWTWRRYGGTNPHDRHMHVSVLPEKALYDNTSRWTIRVA